MTTIGAGRYQLGDEIARGAIGVVLRGTVSATGEPVAVKRLRPETAGHPESVVGFLGEAEILSRLAHPGIVRLRELLAESDGYALVLDLLDGADLRRRVRGGGPLAPALAVSVAAAVADALAYLHAQGYLHGDIKPGNIVLPDDGSPARLVDFGVARRIGQGDRATYATPEYVAPEVVLGDAPTPAADVYALGMVLFELACGRSAYRGGPSDEVMRRHLTCVPVPPPGLPEPLWPVISECLSFDRARRPSAATVAARLHPLAGVLAALAPAGPIPDDVVTWWPREAEDTAPVLGLQRVAWVPASRQSPEPAAPERLVAVPMPDRGSAAAPEPDGLLAGLGADSDHPVPDAAQPEPATLIGYQPQPLRPAAGEPLRATTGAEPLRAVAGAEPWRAEGVGPLPVGGAVPVWPGNPAQFPAGPAGERRSKLPLLIGVGAAALVLLALLGVGGWLLRGQFGGGPVAGPSTSPSRSTPTPGNARPTDSTPASPSNAASPSPSDAASPRPVEPTATPTRRPTPTPTLPSGLPSIGAPLPTFP